MTLPLLAILQSNEPAGDSHDFMQESMKCDYWLSGRGQLGDVRAKKGYMSCCFHIYSGTQHANCIGSELNMWHLVA